MHLFAAGLVAMTAAGQILFKIVANEGTSAATFMAPRPIVIALVAFGIYGAASILWILLLQHVPLSRVYPYLGLSFIIVPIAAHFLLGEALMPRHLLGSAIIAFGVVVAVSA